MPDADLLKRLATEPIPGDNPTGESARYDEAFGVLEAEVAKLENPAGGEVDWRAVRDGTATLLGSRSKDALLAAWHARALWHTEGFPGLAAGLGMVREMLATFWDNLHPQRIRPRRAALEWLSEKLSATLDAGQLASDPAGCAACLAEIEAIIAWSDGRFEGEDCGMLVLASCLRSAGSQGDGSAGGETATASGTEPVGAAPGGAPAGPIANRQQAVARLRELADWWARHEPSSPMVPLLNRAVTFSDLDFEAVFSLLLRSKGEAKDYMWDVLGLNDKAGAASGEG